MNSEVEAIKQWEPRLARSGVSVDFGPVRIRMEAAGTLELRQYIAERIATALSLCRGMENLEISKGNGQLKEHATKTERGPKA